MLTHLQPVGKKKEPLAAMRASLFCFVAIVVTAMLAGAALGADKLSGKYCGSYLFFIKGTLDIKSDTTFSLDLDIAGSKTSCPDVTYALKANNDVELPDLSSPTNCVGKLMKDNSLDTLKIAYDPRYNTINLDAGVGSVELKRC